MANRYIWILAVCMTGTALGDGGAAHPHFRSSRSAVEVMDASVPPFETPASLACIYGLVPTIVPGCPVAGTTELPTGGSGLIVVVNAYDYPNAAQDLNVFSRHFGIPECNHANPCFKVVYANGTQPPLDALWASNASNVIEYAHAFAPQATVVLLETPSGTMADLMRGVHLANRIITTSSPNGRGAVIMPFGGFEDGSQTVFDPLFRAPGVIYISGNEGAPGILEYPATSPNVLALGGTSVVRDSAGMFQIEIASTFWAGGPSTMEARPVYQDAIQSIVGDARGVPDVAFSADPIHGAEIYYDSVPLDQFVGWQYTGNVCFGEAAWAALIDRAGHGAAGTLAELSLIYGHLGDTASFRDIVHGQAIGVRAAPGWDFLTGIGVPVGLRGK